MVGFPVSAGGVLTSGGSIANLMAIVAARHGLGEDFRSARLYCSDQLHHSIQKAALIAGLPARAVRIVSSDACFRVDMNALAVAIQEDLADGLRPFLVVGNAGTTSTGAVDDLEQLAHLAKRHQLWFHVDAAYGGFFLLTERGRGAMRGIEHADSVVLDPHKSLFLPYGTGTIVVRELETLRRSHELHSHYIDAVSDAGASYNFADVSPEMSREFRGLRVWFPMQVLGADAFRDELNEKLDLARWASEALSADRRIKLLATPQLSTLAFRVCADSQADSDRLSERLLNGVNARGRVNLSSTVLHGQYAIRICVLSFRVKKRNLEHCLEDIRSELASLA
jgi:aromatic-L-amino-acid/L-tryptophan decarboxylase